MERLLIRFMCLLYSYIPCILAYVISRPDDIEAADLSDFSLKWRGYQILPVDSRIDLFAISLSHSTLSAVALGIRPRRTPDKDAVSCVAAFALSLPHLQKRLLQFLHPVAVFSINSQHHVVS